MPSAIHYVGYVEEDETPEMIMKKFEELEKVGCKQLHFIKLSTIHSLHLFQLFLCDSELKLN